MFSSFAGSTLITSFGRGVGTSKYEEYTTTAAKKSAPTEAHFLVKLDELRAKLKSAYEKIELLTLDVAKKDSDLKVNADHINKLKKKVVKLRQEGIDFLARLLPDIFRKLIFDGENEIFQIFQYVFYHCNYIFIYS